MALDPNDVNRHLRSLFGQHEDSFQDAWVEILKCNAQTITEVAPMESLHSPAGRNGLDCVENRSSLRKIALNPGGSSWKKRGRRKRAS